mgnify:CR=1 FL=1
MKQLRSELKDDWRYRSAYQKEYEVGRSINDKYIVKYESIDENTDGLYILMEHVNGHTLDEKLVQEPEYFSRGDNFEKLFIFIPQHTHIYIIIPRDKTIVSYCTQESSRK